MAATPLTELLDPAFVQGLPLLPIEEVRSRRDQAMEVEVERSYMRRLVQGRMDIAVSEAKRREMGEPPTKLSDLVERLPEILAEHVHSPGVGRLPMLIAPGELDNTDTERLDVIVDPERISELDDDALRSTVAALSALEREVSAERRGLHAVIDQLQEDLVRRYKSGEASVDTLLS